MKNYRMYATSVNERYIDEIADALRRGQVIIYPTDTLYAIGCDALNNRAVERVCQIKGINPAKQRLSMVCADISQASEFARIDNEAYLYSGVIFPDLSHSSFRHRPDSPRHSKDAMRPA